MEAFGSFITVFLVVVIVWLFIRSNCRRCTLPGPKGWPLLGVLPYLPKKCYKYFTELSKQYGDIYCCRLGTTDLVIVSNLDILDDIFRRRGAIFNNRFLNLPENIDLPLGFAELHLTDKWDELRKFTVKVLNKRELGDRSFQELLSDEATQLFKHLADSYGTKPFNPTNDIHHCMGNIIFSVLFRTRWAYDDTGLAELLEAAHTAPQVINPSYYFLIPTFVHYLGRFNFIPMKSIRMVQLAFEKLSGFSDVEISKHLMNNNSTLNPDEEQAHRHFADIFLSTADGKKSKGEQTYMTVNSLKGVVANLFLGGLDSTATLLTWFILLLVKYQDVQKKAREEVNVIIGRERSPTLTDRDQMSYVNAFIQETHRFVSAAPLGSYHLVSEDTEYDGYFIPKGTHVAQNLWAIHHDEANFKDPFVFNPERFIDDEGAFTKSRLVVPYGTGKRICPGEVLAQRELFLFVATLLQKFDLQPPEGVSPDSISVEGVYNGAGIFVPDFKVRFMPLTNPST
ncbi:cytochrome P450 2F2-like [Apostichopus japonicus]|uniref:cytochrome P450 2F2-like n=1 Tax=Stichopus japonicus TaxID=307972 RepID=UPI003AB445CB